MTVDVSGSFLSPRRPRLTLPLPHAATEPKFKFKLTEPMRFAILNAVELDDEMSALIAEKQ